MRAVRLHGVGQLKFEQVAQPDALAPDSVRLRVQAIGICGSDLHNFRTGQWIGRLPIIPGHELAGDIVEVGSDISDFYAGELVVADSRVTCGACLPCQENRNNVCERLGYLGEVCDGGFAEFVSLPRARLLRVPDGVPSHIAALAEPLGVALHVIRRLKPLPGMPVLIAGAGPIGGLVAILLDHLGFGPLLIIERNAERAALVAELTTAKIVTADSAEISRCIAPARLRHAVEATGSQAMLSMLSTALSGGGRLALVGLFRGQPAFDLNRIVEREIDVVGCSVFCDEQREALDLLVPLKQKLERVVSPPIRLEDVPAEYERLLAGHTSFLKTIVRP